MKLSPSEQLTFVTTRIQCEDDVGAVSVGTGFFFVFKLNEERSIPIIITNNHVIDGSIKGTFNLTKADEEGNPIIGEFVSITLDNFQDQWIPHPDPNIDLCTMPMAQLLRMSKDQNLRFFFQTLGEDLLPNKDQLEGLSALEDILMIGYPVGIWDSVNNMPIFRRGITATHPNINYEGRDEFLIDAACFPGSSGSPVLLYNHGSYATKGGTTVIGTRVFLLGTLYAGPQHTIEGEIKVLPIPTRMQDILLSRIPINLGNVIKSKKIKEFKSLLLPKK